MPAAVRPLVDKYSKVFGGRPPGLPPFRGTGPCINLIPGSRPPWRRPNRLTPAEEAEAKKNTAEGLERGIIQHSTSPFASPIMFVTKKDGTLRQVQDYTALNTITIKDRHPLPHVQSILDKLAGCQWLSCMDLDSAYYQVLLDPSDVPKTAYVTPFGLFEFKVLTMGLCNAPAAFVAELSKVFAGILGEFVMLYFDDAIIFSRTEADHIRHLEIVFKRLLDSELYVKLSKCTFMVHELKFLGHVVGRHGVKVDPDKH